MDQVIIVDFNELEFLNEFYYALTLSVEEGLLLHLPMPDFYVFLGEAIYDSYLLPDIC